IVAISTSRSSLPVLHSRLPRRLIYDGLERRCCQTCRLTQLREGPLFGLLPCFLLAAAAASSSTVFARFASGAAVEKGEEEAAAEVLVVDAEEAARRGKRLRVSFPRSDMFAG
ncbi:MAG: hypothetical protein CMN74_08085, partial [Sphingorhabdus sp.]|nr:hypothetical protein [Sphingorhabdus sp.]